MKKKINARLLTLILLIATVLCAVIACFVSFSLQNNNTADKDDAAITEISAPDRGVDTTAAVAPPLWAQTHTTSVDLPYFTNNSYTFLQVTNYNSTYMTVSSTSNCSWFESVGVRVTTKTIGDSGSITFTANSGYTLGGPSSLTLTFTIVKADQTPSITSTATTVTYGSSITMTGSGEGTLSWSSSDTTIATVNSSTGVVTPVKVGSVTITLTAAGNTNYNKGTATKTITISARNISNATFGTIAAQTYNYGTAITPTPTITDSGISKTLTNNTDFTFSYSNNINAGSATITITGKGNYTGTKSTTFTINGRNLSGATIGTITNQSYDGTEKKPTATVTIGSVTLSSSTDFTFSWSNNINAGTATLTITGKGNYAGTKSASFTISARNISNATVAAIAAQSYTGAAKTPVPTVTDLSKTLTRDTDYTLSYSNNVAVGTAKITITGKGNYTGTKEVSFSITARNISSATVAAIGACYYDGAAKEPTPAVTDGGSALVEGVDFTYSYRDNIDVGTATLILTGMGNYTGTKEVSFSIQPPTISIANVTISQDTYTYDGTAKEPRVTLVQIGSLTLREGVDFTVSYSSNTNAGTAKVVITGIGDYTGTKEVNFTINPADISYATVSGLQIEYTYTGTAVEPPITITLDGKTLTKNTDYLIVYSNNLNVGTATITITGSRNYTGTLTDGFTIISADLSTATVTGIDATPKYTGSAIEPLPVVNLNGLLLVKDTDYTVTYTDNTELGTATVTITGLGNFTGTVTKTFVIVAADISSATVTGINASYGYTGSAIEPPLTVELNGKTLDSGTDYTVIYTDNVNKGTATATITGIGNYTGTVVTTFVIGEGDINDATVSGIGATYGYTGSAITPEHMVIYNSILLDEGTDYTVTYSPNVDLGIVTVTITGLGNFTGTATKTFEIVAADISKATITDVDAEYPYTGSAITPEPTVTLNGVALVKDRDYTVTYRNNTNIGAGIVVVTGIGNYAGIKETAFTIGVADITNATVTNVDAEYPWTGTAIEPPLTVTLKGVVLVKDRDYTVTYTDNTEVGVASYEITGIGNYTGNITGSFEIMKAKPTVNISYADWDGTDKLFTGNALPTIEATATYNGVTVTGTIAWDTVDGVTPALNDGANDYNWTFTPDDTDHYAEITGKETLTAEMPSYIAIRAEWKDGAQPELFTSSSVSVILQNLKVTGIFNDGKTAEITGGFTFVGSWDNSGTNSTVSMPTVGGDNFRITVYFGSLTNALTVDVEIKNVELEKITVEKADGDEIRKEYTALETFDTETIKVVAKYNDGSEKELKYGKGGYVVEYEDGEYLQYGDEKITITYTENGKQQTEEIDGITVEKKKIDEELKLNAEDTDYLGKSVAEGIAIENVPEWLEVTYVYEDSEGNKIEASAVKNAGTYKVTAKFKVDKNHEEIADITATFKIKKVDPILSPAVGGNFATGTALSELTLTTGNDTTAGTITWDDGGFELKAGINRCYYTFTPEDTVNYNVVHGYVDITSEAAQTVATEAGGSLVGWEIALIIICIVIAIIAIAALILALRVRNVTSDSDGFYDDVTEDDLLA